MKLVLFISFAQTIIIPFVSERNFYQHANFISGYKSLQEEILSMIKRLPAIFLRYAKPNAACSWTFKPLHNFSETNESKKENQIEPKIQPKEQPKRSKITGGRIIALVVGVSWIFILGVYLNAEKFLMAARKGEPLPVRDSSSSKNVLPEEYRSEYIDKVKRKMRLKAKKDKSQEITIITKGDEEELD